MKLAALLSTGLAQEMQSELRVVSPELSALGSRLSALGSRLSALGSRLEILLSEGCFCVFQSMGNIKRLYR